MPLSRVELEKKFVSLVKESDDAELARLIVEAGLIDAVSYAREIDKSEPLQLAAHVYGVDIGAIRNEATKEKGPRPRSREPRKWRRLANTANHQMTERRAVQAPPFLMSLCKITCVAPLILLASPALSATCYRFSP